MGGSTTRDTILSVLREALERGNKYHWQLSGRKFSKYPPDLFGPEAFGKAYRLDCSSFLILVYKAAGAPDPNGTDYDGTGNTASLVQRGNVTEEPLPGDAVFYGSNPLYPDHVDVYIGDGEVIGFGSTPVKKRKVTDRTNFLFYMSFFQSGALFDRTSWFQYRQRDQGLVRLERIMLESLRVEELSLRTPVAFRGRISESALNIQQRIRVTIDTLGEVTHGPCRWTPRGQMLPKKGDLALIMFDETQEPWIVVWWPK